MRAFASERVVVSLAMDGRGAYGKAGPAASRYSSENLPKSAAGMSSPCRVEPMSPLVTHCNCWGRLQQVATRKRHLLERRCLKFCCDFCQLRTGCGTWIRTK